ncbi:hypothetical protein AMJ57_02130 [Parcubacteria bacterium SG8_24]|nr:MAG: hypothetical protein AMJ57_02130 [Parcubacteria bacterium SG8_24]
MAKKMSGLGRGLGALIPQKTEVNTVAVQRPADDRESSPDASREAGNGTLHVPVSSIMANSEQPRSHFGHNGLEELMKSIREHGILQPLSVSSRGAGKYELIAGERRLRAARMLGLPTVPVIVRDADRRDRLILALIENIQREDLNPIEEAKAYRRLMDDFGLTQEAVAGQGGKARSTVANTLRLLELPVPIQEALAAGKIAAGSARTLVGIDDERKQLALFRKMLSGNITSRQAEVGASRVKGRNRQDPALLAAAGRVREALGTKVEISGKKGRGKVVLHYFSEEELERLIERLSS